MIDDGLDECTCGHIRYHHRPGCTHIEGAFSYTHGRICECTKFELAKTYDPGLGE